MANSFMYVEEGELWLQLKPGHSVTGNWLRENAPTLLAQYWDLENPDLRDQVALRIEQRLNEVEGPLPVSGATETRNSTRRAEIRDQPSVAQLADHALVQEWTEALERSDVVLTATDASQLGHTLDGSLATEYGLAREDVFEIEIGAD